MDLHLLHLLDLLDGSIATPEDWAKNGCTIDNSPLVEATYDMAGKTWVVDQPSPARIRAARSKLSQTRAAALVGKTARTWQNWEAPTTSREHRAIDTAVWQLFIMRKFGCEPDAGPGSIGFRPYTAPWEPAPTLAQQLERRFFLMRLSTDQKLAALGLHAGADMALARALRGNGIEKSRDMKDRAEILLGLHERMKTIYPDRDETFIDMWILEEYTGLENRAPIQVIEAEGFAGLLKVRDFFATYSSDMDVRTVDLESLLNREFQL